MRVQIVSSKPLLGPGSTLVTMESLRSVGDFILAIRPWISQLDHLNGLVDSWSYRSSGSVYQQQQAGSHQAVNQQVSGSQQSGSSSQVAETQPSGISSQAPTPAGPQSSTTTHVPESQSTSTAGTEQSPAVSSAAAVQAQSLQQQQQQVQQQQVHTVPRIWVELDGIIQKDSLNSKDISLSICA